MNNRMCINRSEQANQQGEYKQIDFSMQNTQKMQNRMKKPKKKQKEDKMHAFMSFLEAPTMSESVIFDSEKKNASDNENYEEFVEDTNQCNICQQKLDPVKKKKCAFCNMQTCNNHLRKRRRMNKKFERICDYCEDKQLFDNYMKLQIKAEEALTTQEEIISMKYNEFLSQVEKKREKRHELIFKTEAVKSQQVEQLQNLKEKEEIIYAQERALQKQEIELKQMSLFVDRLSSSMKTNLQEDYKILLLENDKLAKDLINLDKRKHQVNKALEKRQKQIQTAYEQWQKKQYLKNLDSQSKMEAKKKGDCSIY